MPNQTKHPLSHAESEHHAILLHYGSKPGRVCGSCIWLETPPGSDRTYCRVAPTLGLTGDAWLDKWIACKEHSPIGGES